MIIFENPGKDQERRLEVEMGPDGFLEISCPHEEFYFYENWGALSEGDRSFFEVMMYAHSELLENFCKHCKAAEGDGKCAKTG